MDNNKNNEEIYGIIYAIINKVDLKIYIGQTVKQNVIGPNSRYGRIEKTHNKKLREDIEELGINNFEVMIIDKAYSKEELDNKEIMYIANTNAKNEEFGYNKLKGGSNFDENMREYLREINKGKHYSEETKKKQSNSQKERWKNMSNERKEELGNIFSKNVKKYWDNVDKEAKKERFKHVSETRIKNGTAKGENNPMHGKNRSEETKRRMSEKLSKKVINITTGEIFNSIKDGAKKYGLIPNSISNCCNGKYKTSGGFKWIKLEDYNNEYKGILINQINNKEE